MRFALSRALLAEAIRAVAGPDADLAISTTCERCGAEHGRVRHAGGQVELSVSYAGDLVVVAAAPAVATAGIGVDVETDDADEARRAAELAPLFAPEAAPSLEKWTRIEAVLKADGRALRVEPAAVTFSEHIPLAHVPGAALPFEVATLPGPAGYVLSAAVAPPAEAAPSEEQARPRRSNWEAPGASARRATRAGAPPAASR